MTTDDDGFEDWAKNPELISQMNYRGVMIRLIESAAVDEVKVVKNPSGDGYTVAAPQALLERLVMKDTLGVWTGAVTLAVMLMINNDLETE